MPIGVVARWKAATVGIGELVHDTDDERDKEAIRAWRLSNSTHVGTDVKCESYTRDLRVFVIMI